MPDNLTRPAKCLVITNSCKDISCLDWQDVSVYQALSHKPGSADYSDYEWFGAMPESHESLVAVITLDDKFLRRNTPQEVLRGLGANGFTFSVYAQGEEVNLLQKGN